MKAICWMGTQDIQALDVPEPQILNPHDAILQVTSTAICGSDLHLYNGWIPTMQSGDILGHEFMGEVVELGPEVKNLAIGDRVVVPFPISCGECWYCKNHFWSACDNTNPNAGLQEALYGFSGAGIFGYSHLMGGYAGGQAQYVRVPFANVGPVKIPNGIADEKVLFLTDILPTGYMAAENANIKPGDVVAVWGAGPVGQFTVLSAFLLGADRVIAIDDIPERLAMARDHGAETINFDDTGDVVEKLKDLTGGRGPDSCIDAVGLEAHGFGAENLYDRFKQLTRTQTDRPTALRHMIQACGKGGTISIAGVYGGFVDKFPIGAAFGKGLTFKMGQTHAHTYIKPLLDRIEADEIDPSYIITNRYGLEQAPEAYKMFNDKQDGTIKVVLKP